MKDYKEYLEQFFVLRNNYEELRDFHEGMARVFIKNDKGNFFGFINRNFEEVIPCKFLLVSDFSEGLAYFEDANSKGFMDKFGNVVLNLALEYTYESTFHDGYALLSKDKRYYYLNRNGEILPEHGFMIAKPFSEGLAIVMDDNGKYGAIDTNFDLKIEYMYDSLNSFSCGLALADKKSFINKDGVVIHDFDDIFVEYGDFYKGYSFYIANGCIWRISLSGNKEIVVDLNGKKGEIIDYKDGILIFKIGNCGYYLDRFLNKKEFKGSLMFFRENLSLLIRNNENGFYYNKKLEIISDTGKVISSCKLSDNYRLSVFSEGLAFIKDCMDGFLGYVNSFGYLIMLNKENVKNNMSKKSLIWYLKKYNIINEVENFYVCYRDNRVYLYDKTDKNMIDIQMVVNDIDSIYCYDNVLMFDNKKFIFVNGRFIDISVIDYEVIEVKEDANLENLLSFDEFEKTHEKKEDNRIDVIDRTSKMNDLMNFINMLTGLYQNVSDEEGFKRVKVDRDLLLLKVRDFYVINPMLKNYLKYLDLALIDWTDVYVVGTDFSNTNVSIDPQVVYQKDMRNCKFDNVNFNLANFNMVKIAGSDFSNALLDFCDINLAIIDEFTLVPNSKKRIRNK